MSISGIKYPSGFIFNNPYGRRHADALLKARSDIYDETLLQQPGFKNNIEVYN